MKISSTLLEKILERRIKGETVYIESDEYGVMAHFFEEGQPLKRPIDTTDSVWNPEAQQYITLIYHGRYSKEYEE